MFRAPTFVRTKGLSFRRSSPDDCRTLGLTNVDLSGGCNPNEKRTKKSVRSRAPDVRR